MCHKGYEKDWLPSQGRDRLSRTPLFRCSQNGTETAQARPRQAARRLLARRATSGFHYTCGPPPFDRDDPAPQTVQPDTVAGFRSGRGHVSPRHSLRRIVGRSCDLGKKNRGFALPPDCRIGRQNPPTRASTGVACLAESILAHFWPLSIRVCRQRSCDRIKAGRGACQRLVLELLLVCYPAAIIFPAGGRLSVQYKAAS